MKKYEIVPLNDITIENITKAMLFHEGEPFATSTQIAKYFGVRHDNLLRKIESFHSFDDFIGSSKLRSQMRIIKGKEYPYFELDADAFTFTCMSFTGKKAESFKLSFIQAFKVATADALTRRVKAETNLALDSYFELRQKTKKGRKNFTDAIQRLCQYAEEQKGSKYSPICPYYKHFTSLAYKAIGVIPTKAHKPQRDALEPNALEHLEVVELYLANEIESLIDFGIPYRSIHALCKKSLKRWKDAVQER